MSKTIAIAQKYFDLSNSGNLDAVKELFTEDTIYVSENTGTYRGVSEIMAMMRGFFDSFEKLAWKIHSLEEETDLSLVTIEFTFSGTKKSGEEVSRSGIENVVVHEGKIARISIRNSREPDDALDNIQNIDASVLGYFWSRYKMHAFATVLISLAFLVLWGETAVSLMFIPVLIIVVLLANASSKVHEAFMRQFASHVSGQYTKRDNPDQLSGLQFKNKRNTQMRHVVSWHHNGQSVRLFNFSHVVSSGKSSRTIHSIVVDVSFEYTFPNIILYPKTSILNIDLSGFQWSKKSTMTNVSLDGSYNNNFGLVTTKGYEIEALEIFTVDLLMYLRDNAPGVTIEFSDNDLYVSIPGRLKNIDQLKSLREVMHHVLNKKAGLIARMEDDFDAMHLFYKH